MTQRISSLRDLTSQEYRRFIVPTAVAGMLVLLAMLINIWIHRGIPALEKSTLIMLIVGAALYITAYSFYLIPAREPRDALIWMNVIISSVGFWLFAFYIPIHLIHYLNLLLLLSVISVSTYAGRLPTLIIIAMATIPHYIHLNSRSIVSFEEWAKQIGIPAVSILVGETIARIQNISRERVHRLEIINAFSRQVAAARDRQDVFEHLNATIPNTLTADSYYVSAVVDDEVHILICYDEGEYFNNISTTAEGTLTNWVVQNQQELFLPDLRKPIKLEGIKIIIVGKDKTSLSWIGAPMNSRQFRGVLALASYQPNAFNRGDLELLSNLARHASLALDNVDRQTELEERARLDSLTGVFNHGYFLEILKKQADESLAHAPPLSLIMLDVDYFKSYNDTYGHLAGDTILTRLCATIRKHIKSTDSVGRWGGEEFIIALPNANASQALIVATRISQSMRELSLLDRDGQLIPAPTVSQGIAIFPQETNDIFALIELADQRLYAAKNRGRDQIEFTPS